MDLSDFWCNKLQNQNIPVLSINSKVFYKMYTNAWQVDTHFLLMKKSSMGRMCLLRLSMGENSLKSISFMKNQYLFITVFYENPYLSAEEENLNFSSRKVVTSTIPFFKCAEIQPQSCICPWQEKSICMTVMFSH